MRFGRTVRVVAGFSAVSLAVNGLTAAPRAAAATPVAAPSPAPTPKAVEADLTRTFRAATAAVLPGALQAGGGDAATSSTASAPAAESATTSAAPPTTPPTTPPTIPPTTTPPTTPTPTTMPPATPPSTEAAAPVAPTPSASARRTRSADLPSPACTDTWTGATGDHSWSTAGNWSTGAVPGSGDVACINAGAGTVTFNDTLFVLALNAAGGLTIAGGQLSITQTSTTNGSAVTGLTMTGGRLTASGDLSVTGGAWNGTTRIDGAQLGLNGTISVSGAATIDASGGSGLTVQNDAAITVAASATLSVAGALTNEAGASIATTAPGTTTVTSFSEGAGTTSGAPVSVTAALGFTGTGSSAFSVPASTTVTLSGDLGAQQSVALEAQDACNGNFPSTLSAAGSFTNAGAITLDHVGTCGGGVSTLLLPAGATLTNTGTVAVTGPAGNEPHQLVGSLVNLGTVTISGGSLSFQTGGTSWDNRGALTIASAASLNLSAGTFSNGTNGRVANSGTFTSSVPMTQGAGVAPGAGQTAPGLPGPYNDIQLTGTASVAFTGGGTSAYAVQPTGGASVTLSGALAAGQRFTEIGHDACNGNYPTSVTTSGNVSSAGTIQLTHVGTCGGGLTTFTVPSGSTLTSTGTLLVDGDGGPHVLAGNLVNQGTVTFTAGTLSYAAAGASWSNQGAVTVASGATLGVGAPASFTNGAGGKVANSGTFISAGTMTQGAGVAPGAGQTAPGLTGTYHDIQLTGSASIAFTGSGVSAYAVQPTGSASITLSGALAAGQRFTEIGQDACTGNLPTSVTTSGDVSSAGTIELTHVGNCGNGTPTLTVVTGRTLTSTGTILVDGDGGPHAIAGTVVSSGTYDQSAGSMTLSGSFVNRGTFGLRRSTSLTVASGSSFTNGAGGAVTVANPSMGNADQATFTDLGTFTEDAGTVATAQQPVIVQGTLAFTGSGASSFVAPPNTTVTLSGDVAAGQTFTIQGQDTCNGNLPTTAHLATDSTVAGTVVLTHSGTCGNGTAFLDVTHGHTLTLTGHLIGDGDGGDSARLLAGAFLNRGTVELRSGTSRLASATDTNDAGSLTNLGTFTVDAGATFGVTGGATFVNGRAPGTGPNPAPGTVANAGTFASSGTVRQGDATATGNPILVGGALGYIGGGASSYDVPPNTSLTLSGNLAQGQALTVTGQDQCNGNFPATATATGSFTSGGTITLDHVGTCGNGTPTLSIPAGSALTNTATGVLAFTDGDGPHRLDGSLVNAGTVHVAAGSTTFATPGSEWDDRGTVVIDPGATLNLGTGATFAVLGGSRVQNQGTVTSTAAVVQGDGTALGGGQATTDQPGPYNDLQLRGGSIAYTGGGQSGWAVQPNVGVTLSGSMAPGQRLRIRGQDQCSGNYPATVTTAGDVNAAGLLELTHIGTCGNGTPALVVAAGTRLTNQGTILLDGDADAGRAQPHAISGVLVSTGTIHVTSGTTTLSQGSLTSSGTVVVDPASTLAVAGDGALANLGGGITVGGTLTSAGSFVQGAGTTSGPSPVDIIGGTLSYTGAGGSSFDVPPNRTAAVAGDLAAGQQLAVNGQDRCDGNFPATLNAAASFTNAGTITLHHLGACGNGQPTLVLPAGATLTNTGTLIAVNEGGTVQINGDVRNEGTLTAQAGPVGISGTLTNSGQVNLGATTTLSVGSIVETDTGVLSTAIDSSPADGRFSKVVASGAATLGGFLAVVPTSSAPSTVGASYPFLTHASETGHFRRVRGQVSPTEAYGVVQGATADQLVVGASDLHVSLAASAATITPTSVGPGQTLTVGFTVTSGGPDVAPGPWVDAVYASTDDTYDPSDTLVARIPHTADLANGGSYAVSTSAFLPGVTPGQYHLVVVPDADGRVSFADLDTQASSALFTVTPPPLLSPGTPISTSVAAGQDLYYRVQVPANDDVAVTATPGAGGEVDLFASPAVLPGVGAHTRSSTSASGPQKVILSESSPGVWYLLLHGDADAGAVPGTPVTLTAALTGLTASSVTPATGANKGPVTVSVAGSDFGADTVVTLVRGTTRIVATGIRRRDSTVAFPTFPLAGAALGAYDLTITSQGRSVTRPGAFTVDGGAAGSVVVYTAAPYSLRYGWAGDVPVTVTNVGETDVRVPVLRLTARANATVAAPGSSVFGDFADLVDPDFSTPTQPLPRGVLPPGATATFTFQVLSASTVAHSVLDTEAQAVTDNDATAIDWPTVVGSDRPQDLSDAAWTRVVASVAAVGGATEGQWALTLQQLIDEAAGFDVTFANEAGIVDYLVRKVLATDAAAPVSGTLLTGSPAHGLRAVPVSLAGSDGTTLHVATTWYDGRFAFWDVPDGALSVVAAGYTPRPAVAIPVGTARTGRTAVVTRGGSLVGHVTRADTSAPVAGARVTATDADGAQSVVADSGGAYQLDGVDAGTVQVAAAADGLQPSTPTPVTAAAGTRTTLDLTLSPGATISGTVTVTGGGAPPAGAAVNASLDGGSFHASGTVAANGAFTVTGLAAGTYTVTATAPGRSPSSQSVTVAAQATHGGVAFTLATGATATGRVTDAATGAGLGGVLVLSDAAVRQQVRTAADGTYSLTGLPAGDQGLHVVAPDRTHVSQVVPITVTGTAPVHPDVALAQLGTITVTVRSAAGDALAGTAITVVGPGVGPDGATTLPLFATTGDDGRTVVTGLLPGAYDVQVDGAPVHQAVTITPASPSQAASLTVAAATVHGRVVTADGHVLSGAQVGLVDATGRVTVATTATDGTYAFTVTRTQTVDVIAADPGTGIVMARGVAASASAGTAVPDLVAGASGLTVHVDDGTAAVKGAAVQLQTGTGADVTVIGGSTAADGSVRFPRLLAGSYVLTVADGVHATTRQAVVVGAAAGSATVHLPAGGTIAGTVSDDHGDLVPGAEVTALDRTTQLSTTVRTGADGGYAMPALPTADRFDLSVSAPGLAPALRSNLAPAGPAADVTLATTGSSLAVTLAPAAAGSALAGGTALLLDSSGSTVATASLGPARSAADRSATATFAPLAPGSYSVAWSAPGTATVTQPVTVAVGPATLTLTAGAPEALPEPFAPGSAAVPLGALTRTSVVDDGRPAAANLVAAQPLGFLGLPSIGDLTAQIYDALVGGITAEPPAFDDPVKEAVFGRSSRARAKHSFNECPPVPELMAQSLILEIDILRARDNAQEQYEEVIRQKKDDLLLFAAQAAGVLGGFLAALASLAGPAEIAAALEAATLIGPEAVGAVTGAVRALQLLNNASSLYGAATGIWSLASGAVSALLSGSASGNGLGFSDILGYLGVLGNLASTIGTDGIKGLNTGLLPKIPAGGQAVLAKAANFFNTALSAISLGSQFQSLIDNEKANLGSYDVSLELYRQLLLRLSAVANALEGAPVKLPNPTCMPPPPPPPPPPPYPPPPPPGPHNHTDNHLPGDPNDLFGAAGVGAAHAIPAGSALPYTVEFENDPRIADAPAVLVTVTEQVPSSVDPASVTLTGFGFGSTTVTVPAGQRAFSQRLDQRDTIGDFVDVAGSFDPTTSTITWTLSTIDPHTGGLDTATTAGFLPVDDAVGSGEGYVTWAGKARTGLADGTVIPAQASIVFDRNAPLATPVWTNLIDANPPTATIVGLPARAKAGPQVVQWTGSDGAGSGVASYDVYVSVDGGPLTRFAQGLTATQTTYQTTAGHTYGFAVSATDAAGNAGAVPTAAQATVTAIASPYVSLVPSRILDTRSGIGSPATKLATGETRSVKVLGVGGVPAAGVSTVVLNVTAVDASVPTFVSEWPTGQPQPTASILNPSPSGGAVPNLVIAQVGQDGRINLFNFQGTVNLIADVVGYYLAPSDPYQGLVPSRILDTRSGLGGPATKLATGETRSVKVVGVGGVPASGVATVVLNVTAVDASVPTFISEWPTGQPQPTASILNPSPKGGAVPNLVIAQVGQDGRINLFNFQGTVNLIADVVGYYVAPSDPYQGLVPSRILDTRSGLGGAATKLATGETRSVTVVGVGGVPATGVAAVVLNVTAVDASVPTFISEWPTGQPQPTASILNPSPSGGAVPNLVIAQVGQDGKINLFNFQGTVNLIADVVGYYTG